MPGLAGQAQFSRFPRSADSSSAHSQAVQQPEAILATLEQDLAASQHVADDIYGEWIKGLKA